MPLIVPANEQGAGFMAAGYARATGRVGVCLVTSGPGATNTVTPVRDCMADSMPIVVICGQVAAGGDRHRRLPGGAGASLMGAVAKHIFLVTDPTQARSHACARPSRSRAPGGPGPVVVDMPKDVQNWQGVFDGQRHAADPRLPRAACTSCARRRLADARPRTVLRMLLGAAQRPLIYAGGGVINGDAADALHEFAQAFGIPVVTTLMGHRRHRHHATAVAAHARHARRCVRQLRRR